MRSSPTRPALNRLFRWPLRVTLPPIKRWTRIAEERRRLASLDERMLRDVGLNRDQVDEEIACAFWDCPPRP